jgi:hypothetical protein
MLNGVGFLWGRVNVREEEWVDNFVEMSVQVSRTRLVREFDWVYHGVGLRGALSLSDKVAIKYHLTSGYFR